MIIDQLIQTLHAFNSKEKQEMSAFLAADFFNKGKNAADIESLYRILLKSLADLPTAGSERLHWLSLRFQEAGMDVKNLDKAISDLHKLSRQYALTSYYHSPENELSRQLDWAKWARTRGLSESGIKAIGRLKDKIQETPEESLDGFRMQWLLEEENHLWAITYLQGKDSSSNIPELITSLDLFYYNYRIELANRYLSHQKSAGLPEVDFDRIDPDFYAQRSTQLAISKKIYALLKKTEPEAAEINDFNDVLKREEEKLSFQTLDHFYAFLRNFCTQMINNGHLHFIPVLYHIYKDNLDRGLFFLNGKLPSGIYLNLVQIAIRANDPAWAKTFTETYKDMVIDDGLGHFFYHLNMAHCLFVEKAYEKTLEYLPLNVSGAHYHYIARRLELKTYYELNSDLLHYKIDAYRKYIERTAGKAVSAQLREMDLNFVNLFAQLSRTPLKDKARSAKLIQRIANKKLVSERLWLIEKARELG